MTDQPLITTRCACGSSAIFSIKPGEEPRRRGAVDLFTRLDPLVETGAPDVVRCKPCWTAVHMARAAVV